MPREPSPFPAVAVEQLQTVIVGNDDAVCATSEAL